ncbi:isochorismate synthase [Sulfobacillus harzensis]|uniref:isochorismate synthase n=1 Tax=Sulfobacillus harzensis TaxID=2729629 RepID=A0A7Y0L4Y5_9FIRM|nr:isochorismate synthase [Sulfobacillus harzensis]NMP23393.1 isochorismate synthase [Sulfobacillus harzensis]
MNRARKSGHIEWFAKSLAIPPARWSAVYARFPGFGWFFRSPGGDLRLGLGLAREWQWADRSHWPRMEEYVRRLRDAGVSHDVWIVGGQAFSAQSNWPGWPAVYLALPMVQVTETKTGTQLTVVLPIAPDAVPETYHRRLEPVWQAFLGPSEEPVAVGPPSSWESQPSRYDWMAKVAEAAAHIRQGALQKVVLAREVTLTFGDALPLETILENLLAQNPDAASFAIRGPEGVFLGATPEILARAHGGVLETMGLAGSAPRGLTPEEDARYAEAMRRDPKIAAEHQAVVTHIREALQPWVSDLQLPAEPILKKLPTVQHLWTPIRGRIDEEAAIWPIVAELGPTPAVAGYPVSPAVNYILNHEPFQRGWYAGTVGWSSVGGDAEWMVALRSGWMRDHRIRLYAGCGIMGDSDPEAELHESDWKLNTMLSALEVEGGLK